MDRSTYSDGTEIHAQQLEYTESSKIAQILRRFRDTAYTGVVQGLTVSLPTQGATTVNLAAGSGYAGYLTSTGASSGGEFVELTASVSGIPLSDYTLSTDNYVCLVYAETASRPEAHPSDGTTRTTRATGTPRVRVFTLAELTALPTTDADLTKDAQDRILVCGIVNANGPGQGLFDADITNASSTSAVITIAEPTTIPGVEIITIDQTTSTTAALTASGGTNPQAQLVYTLTAIAPFTATLTYRAPGATVASGAETLTTGSTTRTLTSGTNSKTITIRINTDLLIRSIASGGGGAITENLTVYETYLTAVRRSGARDEQHRRTTGSTLTQTLNPHGELLQDLGQSHQAGTLMLGLNLLTTAGQSTVARLETPQAAAGTKTLLWEIALAGASAPRRIRFYANTNQGLDVTVNARWYDPTPTWYKDDDAQSASKFTFFSSGFASFAQTGAGPFNDSSWTSIPFFNSGLAGSDSQGQVSLNGQTFFGGLLMDTAQKLRSAKMVANYGASGVNNRTLIFQSEDNGGAIPQSCVRMYRAHTGTSSLTHVLELTQNAVWDGSAWDRGQPGVVASKIQIGSTGILFLQRLAGSLDTWDDTVSTNGWDATGADGSVSGAVIDLATGEFGWTSARTFKKAILGASGHVRVDASDIIVSVSTSSPEGATCGMQKIGSSNNAVVWPVELPTGAIVTACVLNGTFAEGTAGSQVRAAMARKPNGAGAPESFKAGGTPYDVLAPPNVSNVDMPLTLDESTTVRTINNDTHSYLVWVGCNNAIPDDLWTIYRIEITYTMTLLRPA
jgi:hypothetical protein